MSFAIEVAVRGADQLGESPVWSTAEQALYWTDLRAPALRRFDPASATLRSWPMPNLCCGVALAREGLILALGRDLVRFDPASTTRTHLLAVEPASGGNRLNEMRGDPSGRLWVGSMRDYAAARSGALYSVDADLTLRRVLAPVTVPNSLAWSPDGTIMYFADTADARLRAYRFDTVTGVCAAMRVLLAADALPGRPDGAAIDAEGCLWSARYGGACLGRIAPNGRIDAVVALPVSQPTACAFGGGDRRTLFVTTARQRLDLGRIAAEPLAGSVLAMRTNVPGLPEPVFG